MSPKNRHSSFSSSGSHYSAASSTFSRSSAASTSTSMTRPDVDLGHFAAARSLPCEFVGYGFCDRTFHLDDVESWIEHIISEHLDNRLPRKAICWFCDDFDFDSKSVGDDRRANYDNRMWHIRDHFMSETGNVNSIRPDHHFNNHLQESQLITTQAYHSARRYDEVPQGPWIIPHNAMPMALEARDARQRVEYKDPHDEERKYRRHRHKAGRSKK
ncbi:hypothetical protein HD806DRAFT_341594 [Xylariaceae sp. AK1471]|nr:hypothetical protein HD806DRAFT_341594 [Xylariaceae sp. AK1471]